MPQQNRPPLPCQAVEAESTGDGSKPNLTANWRDWLDLPLRGWFGDDGVETLDWTVSA